MNVRDWAFFLDLQLLDNKIWGCPVEEQLKEVKKFKKKWGIEDDKE